MFSLARTENADETLPNAVRVEVDLAVWLHNFTASIISGQAYIEPTTAELALCRSAIVAMINGGQFVTQLSSLGFTAIDAIDAATKRPFRLLAGNSATPRAWGAYVIDMSQPLRGAIGAPHPVFDQNTEKMALKLWQRNPGTLLMISGSHRTETSGTNIRDVAHQKGSLFHAVAQEMIMRRLPQLQQHGYKNISDPRHDVIVSSGDSKDTAALHRLAAEIQAAGFTVARNWDGTATVLAGFTNGQGDAARLGGSAFAHVEVSNRVRMDTEMRDKYIEAVITARYFE